MIKNEKGVALMMVLWVLILLSFIALEFAHSMRTEVDVTRNFRDEVQAYYLARAGIEVGRYELAISGSQTPHYRDLENGRLVFGKGEGGDCKSPPKCRVSELGGGKFEYTFEAAGDKYPLNSLAKNEVAIKKFLEKYCEIETMTEEWSNITQSIIDWVDPPSDLYQVPGVGAEDDWYKSHDRGYECKDASFDNEDELSLIRGLRIEDDDSDEEIERKKKIVATFKRYFSVNPELENENIKKAKDFFINTASPEVVQMVYDIGLINQLPEDIETKKSENCGIYENFAPGYYYVISTAIMKGSPVQRSVKGSFLKNKGDQTYWQPKYWNDNYISEYSDPNQTDDSERPEEEE